MPALLTISIYDVHHVVGRFVRLYRQVQVVSDCLTFACSVICCQCWAMLPENPDLVDSRSSHEGFMFLPQRVIDERKAGGDLPKSEIFTEFCPQKEDSEEVQMKCIEFWKKQNDFLLKLQTKSIENNKPLNMEIKEHPSGISSKAQGDELPAVHNKSKITDSDLISPTSPRLA